MSIEGRITVDALLHDKDGTTSLKVLSLQDSDSYPSGVAAMWTGTCGTAAVTLQLAPTTYRNAAGEFQTLQPGGINGRVVFFANGNGGRLTQQNGELHLLSWQHAAVSNIDEQEWISVAGLQGTISYTVIMLES